MNVLQHVARFHKGVYSILFYSILTSGSLPSGSIVDAPQTTPRQQRGWSAEGSVKKSMEHQAEEINYLEGGSGGGNRKVFKAERKEERESRARRLSGKEFQMVGAAYEKERRPILESIRGQTRVFWYRV